MIFLALLSVILYFLGYTTAAGILGIIFTLWFILNYFGNILLMILWVIINIANISHFLSPKLSYFYKIGIASSMTVLEITVVFWCFVLLASIFGGIFSTLRDKLKI